MDPHAKMPYARELADELTRYATALELDETKAPPPEKVHKTLTDSQVQVVRWQYPALKA